MHHTYFVIASQQKAGVAIQSLDCFVAPLLAMTMLATA